MAKIAKKATPKLASTENISPDIVSETDTIVQSETNTLAQNETDTVVESQTDTIAESQTDTVAQSQTNTVAQTENSERQVVLEIENLTKCYGERKSVDNLNLEVYRGEVFGFLGPNGAGKTTTIRMVTGLATPTTGAIHICGIDITKDFQGAIRNIGGIIENPEMYKYMTGWENMKYYAGLYGNISDEQIMKVVKLVRMEGRIHEKVKRYSLGMRQRVGIAQSLLHNPALLLLDEPTNGLDPAGIHEMRDFLKMLAHEQNLAVFISSHILTEMQLMCDRVGIVNKGKLIAVKTVKEWVLDDSEEKIIKLIVSDTDKAVAELTKLNASVQLNGELIIAKISKNNLAKVSINLGKKGVAILSMSQGEKSLEDTFLELTGSGGAIT